MSIRSRQRRARRAQTVIDITSLLDIIFLLIIFLIVSTTFRKAEHAFTVELPTAGTATEAVTTDKTTVYVTRATPRRPSTGPCSRRGCAHYTA